VSSDIDIIQPPAHADASNVTITVYDDDACVSVSRDFGGAHNPLLTSTGTCTQGPQFNGTTFYLRPSSCTPASSNITIRVYTDTQCIIPFSQVPPPPHPVPFSQLPPPLLPLTLPPNLQVSQPSSSCDASNAPPGYAAMKFTCVPPPPPPPPPPVTTITVYDDDACTTPSPSFYGASNPLNLR